MAAMYVKVPTEPRVEHQEDRQEYNILAPMFERYGFKITFFGHDDVSFYVLDQLDKQGFVPVHSRHFLSRKDFAAFVSLMKRLDSSEKRVNQLMIDVVSKQCRDLQ